MGACCDSNDQSSTQLLLPRQTLGETNGKKLVEEAVVNASEDPIKNQNTKRINQMKMRQNRQQPTRISSNSIAESGMSYKKGYKHVETFVSASGIERQSLIQRIADPNKLSQVFTSKISLASNRESLPLVTKTKFTYYPSQNQERHDEKGTTQSHPPK